MKRVATLILNRNLPEITDALADHLEKYDGDQTDIYVIEAGSDPGRLSYHTSWYADTPEIRSIGLRYCRGMNYGLSHLWHEEKFSGYDAFFLLTNDTEFSNTPVIAPLMQIMDAHAHLGILSPCSRIWGEAQLLKSEPVKYFWFVHNSALLLRREFIEVVMEPEGDGILEFLFDGTNFRGYGTESELIAKAYINDWAAAITSDVWAEENETHLLNKADLIKTEVFEENMRLYLREGQKWMHRKYGFNSRWSMQQYVKSFYDSFFEYHPECASYKI